MNDEPKEILVKKQAGSGPHLTGPRWEGSIWGPVKPIVPRAKKPTGVHNPPPDRIPGGVLKKRSTEKISRFRSEEAGFDLSEEGREKYLNLLESTEKVDMRQLALIEERIPGDREKIITVLENLALGARHREALGDVDWTWSHLSVYRSRYPVIQELYKQVSRIGEETRKIVRLDEAHKRAVDGVSEPVYSPSGKYLGDKIRYSDSLLQMFLKADHPDKFADRQKIETTGVVLHMQMGLRETVRDKPLEQGDIEVTSPFAEEKKDDLPPGV
jgi:hypothetical protein